MAKQKTTKRKKKSSQAKQDNQTMYASQELRDNHNQSASQQPRDNQAMNAPRTPGQARLALKKKVRMFYDLQRLRLQTSGRIYKRSDKIEIHLADIDQQILDYRAKELEKFERLALGDVIVELKQLRIYNDVLCDKTRFRGLGPTMSGVILAEFDICKEDTPSKMWAFAGLAPIQADRCTLCHRIVEDSSHVKFRNEKEVKCKNIATYPSGKARRPTKGEELPYNAFLKTKLIGVLGGCLLKANSPWRKFYDDYKHRKESAGWGISDGHRHNAAIRYMVKMLLLEIWREWRAIEGLPVRPSYQEEKLGHSHLHSDNHDAYASHNGCDNHGRDASHMDGDNQGMYASQLPGDNQRINASQLPGDNHRTNASQMVGDNHGSDAEIDAELANQ